MPPPRALFCLITILAVTSACERDSAPTSTVPSGAASAIAAKRAPKSKSERPRGGKRFSMYSQHFKVGDQHDIKGVSVKLVEMTKAGDAYRAKFEVGGKAHDVGKGDCFEAGAHECDVHKDGVKDWCVGSAWETGALIAPKGHH